MRRLLPCLALLCGPLVLVLIVSCSRQDGPAAEPEDYPDGPSLLDCTGKDGVSPKQLRKKQEEWASFLGCDIEESVEVANRVKMSFVLVPPGKFLMGTPAEEQDYVTNELFGGKRQVWQDHEMLHEVTLTRPFFLGKYEVTQAQFEALTGKNPSEFKGADLPVENISWEMAQGYAADLTKRLGDKHTYRLPTEAEWEYSCRGGRPASMPFGVGDGKALSSRQANFNGGNPFGNIEKGPELEKTCPVGSYKPNALGLYDMHGNVWEFCADRHKPYTKESVTNPTNATKGGLVICRGGGWFNSGWACRASFRGSQSQDFWLHDYGFRLARSASKNR